MFLVPADARVHFDFLRRLVNNRGLNEVGYFKKTAFIFTYLRRRSFGAAAFDNR